MLSREDHELACDIFLEACEVDDPEERRAFIEERCGGREDLTDAVLDLLAADANSEQLVDITRDHDGIRRTVLAISGEGEIPSAIGPFEILDVLGEGGMGIVYDARQKVPSRQVALKVVRPAFATDAVLRLFEREIEILGRLSHPGIAQVFQAGLAGDASSGRPFFAMERVDGSPLLHHADEAKLDRRSRVQLVQRICEAVHHAHVNGVVHRDLKPGNILVEPPSEEGSPLGHPKILDFGIARLTDADTSTLAEDRTRLLGTVSYMSPEQAEGHAVDARADVYSLGVILHELLSGQLPYPTRDTSIASAVRRIVDDPPEPLSQVDPDIDRDLEAVALRALAKLPDDRYASASELRADLGRWLDGRPVEARLYTTWDKLRLFVRRHHVAVSVATAIVLILITASIAVWRSTQNERDAIALANDHKRRVFDALARAPGLYELFDRDEIEDDTLEILTPAHRPVIESWLTRAEAYDDFGASIEWGRQRIDELDDDPGVRSYLREQFDTMQARIDELYGTDGWVAHARRQLERIEETIEVTTVDYAEEWEAARQEIALDPQYRGLDLPVQIGLIPLGIHPTSELQEFWVYGTGDEPEWDPDDECYRIDHETAIVLVLLPPGTAKIGVRQPTSEVDEYLRVHSTELEAFFLGKYELTQGQYARVGGSEPSRYKPGSLVNDSRIPNPTGAHPVEQVSRFEVSFVLNRRGLTLPTEAQWEYAARAGRETPWSVGHSLEALFEAANLADASARGLFTGVTSTYSDGHAITAPVGSLKPNLFSLYDTHGNVAEWCLDTFRPRAYEEFPDLREGDGLRNIPGYGNPNLDYVFRGGSLIDSPEHARLAYREGRPGLHREAWIGARAARGIEPPFEDE